ncbi:MAG: peptide chain release factor N(5)-glutamine methyltransferase [Bacillota bacterium]|nr:peptide chain release factor N(5)-glutamine methyltransferase [Candidatus Fermentithermobacillaceae bacterium]
MDAGQVLAWGRQTLLGKTEYPARDAAALLAHVLGCSASDLYLYPETLVTQAQFDTYSFLIARRVLQEPIAYIVGYREFMGLRFKVDKRVLIPRPETEILVETCLSVIADMLREPRTGPVTVCDVCCGSGAVGLSILKLLPQVCPSTERPAAADGRTQTDESVAVEGVPTEGVPVESVPVENVPVEGVPIEGVPMGGVPVADDVYGRLKVFLTDISQDALDVAEENAEGLGVLQYARFLLGDGLEPLERGGLKGKVDLIASNPPYIPSHVIPTLGREVKCYEPSLALDGGRDGMYFIEHLITRAPSVLAPGGYLIMEIGHDQADKCRQLLVTARPKHKAREDSSQLPGNTWLQRNPLPWLEWRFVKDYAGKERVLVAKLQR